jgi:hypothetical protein
MVALNPSLLVLLLCTSAPLVAQTKSWEVTEHVKSVEIGTAQEHKWDVQNDGPGNIVVKTKNSDGSDGPEVPIPAGSTKEVTRPPQGSAHIVRDGTDAKGTWRPKTS